MKHPLRHAEQQHVEANWRSDQYGRPEDAEDKHPEAAKFDGDPNPVESTDRNRENHRIHDGRADHGSYPRKILAIMVPSP